MKESKRKSENYKSGKIDKKLSVSGINTTGGLKPEKSKVQCKLCKKFFVSLPTHLNRSKCKDENTSMGELKVICYSKSNQGFSKKKE